MPDGNKAAARMLGYIQRVESIEAQIAELMKEKKEEFGQAKDEGFSVPALKQMIRERKFTPEERRTWTATLQAYRAALGMLDGTPLGDEARRQFFPEPPKADTPEGDPAQDHLPEIEPPAKPKEPLTAEQIQAARDEGGEAARNGQMISDNPYSFDDQRRAAWDEGFCMNADDDDGDGMGIPKAFRPKEKPKAGKKAPDAQPAANDQPPADANKEAA